VYQTAKLLVMTLVLPPGGPAALMLLGVLVLRRRPGLGRGLAVAGAALLWASSLPIVAAALVTALGGARPLDPAGAKRAEAIVILGGGVRPLAPEYGGDTLGRLTLERVRYGAHLARRTGLPVLVTGGASEPAVRAEADLMRLALEAEFGIAVRWVDDSARNTRENARRSAKLLHADGLRRAIVVVHGFDVHRARREFEAAGLEVFAAPTQVPRWGLLELSDFLPSAAALQTTYYALYEVLALARDRLLGPVS
jgi:uncharacterized SAM-binding protein YcdF (DUF218 family)